MAGPKSTQTRAVGITDNVHFYTYYSYFFCETLIGPNHHEGSLRNTPNLEFSVNNVRAIPNCDCSV